MRIERHVPEYGSRCARAGGKAMADESARHTGKEEYLLDAGPPSRDEIEDQLIDRIVQKGAGRVSPGRQPVPRAARAQR